MFEIPLFAIFEILSQIRENSLIWSSLIWSTHCNQKSKYFWNYFLAVHVDQIDAFKEALAAQVEHGDNASALSLAEKFIEEVSRLVEMNPKLEAHENDEPGLFCFACDEKEANVRLSSCSCQTMFCQDCMIR